MNENIIKTIKVEFTNDDLTRMNKCLGSKNGEDWNGELQDWTEEEFHDLIMEGFIKFYRDRMKNDL